MVRGSAKGLQPPERCLCDSGVLGGSGNWNMESASNSNGGSPIHEFSGAAILVCGGRYYSNYRLVLRLLKRLSPRLIIHGAATGADTLAGQAAEAMGIPCEAYPADWSKGRKAGPIRNSQMLARLVSLPKPRLILAFPGGDGTANMCRQALQASELVLRVRA